MTIEDLLGANATDLEQMSDDQLKEYLKDILELEPKPLGRVIIISDECPIRPSKKSKTKVTKAMEEELLIKEMEKEIAEMKEKGVI